MRIFHLFGVGRKVVSIIVIRNAHLGVSLCFFYISDGIFRPIKSIVIANVSRATLAMCNRPALVFASMSSRRIGQL